MPAPEPPSEAERVDGVSLTFLSLAHLVVLGAGIALAEVGRLLWGWLPLATYALLCLAVAAYVFVYYFDALVREGEALTEAAEGGEGDAALLEGGSPYETREGVAMSLTVVATGLLCLTVLWGLLMREAMLADPDAFRGVAPDGEVSRWTGVGFALDNLLHALPLDVGTILGVAFAPVSADGVLARVLVLAFRLVFDAIVVKAILTQWRVHRLMRRRAQLLREREETAAAARERRTRHRA